MTIYHGSQYVPLGPRFEPPRAGTMPERFERPPSPARLDNYDQRQARARELTVGDNTVISKSMADARERINRRRERQVSAKSKETNNDAPIH